MLKKEPFVFFSKNQIEERIKELGEQISKDYEGIPITALGVLKGSILFYSDLVKQITLPVFFDFIQVRSYGDRTEPSEIELVSTPSTLLKDKYVLIIEDIVDTGHTINFITHYVNQFNPQEVKVCTFLDKPSRREVETDIHYCGFQIPDAFVIGYGLDYAQKYRNLPYVDTLESN